MDCTDTKQYFFIKVRVYLSATMLILLSDGLFSRALPYCDEVNVTKTGRQCQHWSSDYPHSVKYWPKLFDHNNCAQADRRDPKPFCYTIDKNTRWEYCNCKVRKPQKCDSADSSNTKIVPQNRASIPTFGSKQNCDLNKIGNLCVTSISGFHCESWAKVKHSLVPLFSKDKYCSNNRKNQQTWCYVKSGGKLIKEKCLKDCRPWNECDRPNSMVFNNERRIENDLIRSYDQYTRSIYDQYGNCLR